MRRFFAAVLLSLLLFSACADTKNVQPVFIPETTPIAWPDELLPNGFPVAEYTEIYSVEQIDNEIKIILFAEKGPIFTLSTVMLFEESLRECGYLRCTAYAEYQNDTFYINRDGDQVRIDTSSNFEGALTQINKQSPTGFTYSITVKKTNEDVRYLFADYPAPNADLGLEECVFDTWPSEYLPAGIPTPSADITIKKMEMKNNGVMITIAGSGKSTGEYLSSLLEKGFLVIDNVCIGKNGDYFYVKTLSYPMTSNDNMTICLQFCKYTEQ